ncbi:MAG: hypothetical protein WEB60_02395 [Terrimicrobiaceae bacterium]
MEGFDISLGRGLKPAFDDAPLRYRCQIDGVDYLHLRGCQNGDLFITRHGWPCSDCLFPDRWFTGEQFKKSGRALAGATGAVYRVPVAHRASPRFALVAKFSRFGQDVGITVVGEQSGDAEFMARVDQAEFLPPFEEFGNLMRLRKMCRGQFVTMAPLAIYSPPTRYLTWQLGRKPHLQETYSRRLIDSQSGGEEAITYDWERLYVLLYRWMDGVDAEQAGNAGLISRERMAEWTRAMTRTLARMNWVVLDHKPRHLILRTDRKTRRVLMRNALPVIGLVDYELLCPLGKSQE